MKDNLLMPGIFLFLCLMIPSCDIEPYSKGKAAYEFYCASCHMEDGSGLAALIPPIAVADYYIENQEKIACIIVNGQKGRIVVNGVVYDQVMEPVPLEPLQITNIINYMNQSWGNNLPVKSIDQVKKELEQCDQ